MYITDNMLDAMKFPHTSKNTVPTWAVPVYTLIGPPVLICAHGVWKDVNIGIRHSAILGGLFSTGITALSTSLFKLTVCFPFLYRRTTYLYSILNIVAVPGSPTLCSTARSLMVLMCVLVFTGLGRSEMSLVYLMVA